MSRQSQIRERLERVVGAYPYSDDVRYLLDRLEAADKLMLRAKPFLIDKGARGLNAEIIKHLKESQ